MIITLFEPGERIVEGMPQIAEVKLSKRNVLALLSKLFMPDSAQTIFCNDIFVNGKGERADSARLHFSVVIEEDEEHYNAPGRARMVGEMHPSTEVILKVLDKSLEVKPSGNTQN